MLSKKALDGTNHLKLLSPTPQVRNTLKIAGLLDYIEVYASLEEAVASF
jgi:anti-anti-sigma regulatory factor